MGHKVLIAVQTNLKKYFDSEKGFTSMRVGIKKV